MTGSTAGRPTFRRLRILFTVGVLIPLLVSCYLPDNFLTEVRVAKTGEYGITFKGDLIWIPLHRDIAEGVLSPDEVAEKVEILYRDLQRDPNFTEMEHIGRGRFRVRYEKTGRLGVRSEVIFLRRNEAMIILSSHEDGRVVIRGRALKAQQRAQILEAGMDYRGKFRVVTDAVGLRGNAQATKPRGVGDYVIYDWTLRSLRDPAPFLEVQLVGPGGQIQPLRPTTGIPSQSGAIPQLSQ